jgi:hypothetical protein
MLKLFKRTPFVGGLSARGYGELKLGYEVDESKTQLYLETLKERQKEMQEHWDSAR